MKKSNILDVAHLAGVSTATVSHVINGTRFVSKEIIMRVNNAIKELDYTPNQMARNLKTGHSNTVLFIVPDIANTFFSTAIEEVENVLASEGYRLLIANTKENPERERMHLRSVDSSVVDGILLASTLDNWEGLKRELPNGIPAVLVDRVLDGCQLDTVYISNYNAVFNAVVDLAFAGHKRIGYITGLPRLSSTQERLSAYSDAMSHCGLFVDPGFVQVGDSMHTSSPRCCAALVEKGCTAIIVSNGIMADDVMYYCYEHGVMGERNISIVGYIDSPINKRMDNYFSAICQPVNEFGKKAGMQILHRMRNSEDAPETIKIDAQFIQGKKLLQKEY